MNRIKHSLAIGLAGASCLGLAIPAKAAPKPMLGYFLNKASVSASVSQRIVACPAVGEGDIKVVTQWNLQAQSVPDYKQFHQIDASAGFLAKRNVDLTLNPDGTLASLNAKSEGQGGQVIASALKLVGTMAPLVSSAGLEKILMKNAYAARFEVLADEVKEAPAIQRCKPEVVALLGDHARLEREISDLAAKLSPDGITDAEKQQIDAKQELLAEIEQRLTIKAAAGDRLDETLGLASPCQTNCTPGTKVRIAPFGERYGNWFESEHLAKAVASIPGSAHGFMVGWSGDGDAAEALFAGSMPTGKSDRELLYRRPVPGVLTGYPCSDAACKPDKSVDGKRASEMIEFPIPQLSGLFRLPVGSAGIFGSREVKIAFDTAGQPTQLSYGSDTGAESIAKTLDGLGEMATSLRDARLNAIKHETELLEAINALEKLKNPSADDGQ